MNEIVTLTKILNSVRLVKNSDATEKRKSETLMNTLERNVLEGRYKTDEEAAQDIYNSTSRSNKYQVLKSKLKTRLLSEFLIVDNADEPLHYSVMILNSEKELIVIKKLLMFGARSFAIRLVQRLLYKAEQYTAISIQLQCYRILREHYWYLGEKTKYESSNKKIAILLSQLKDELRSYELHETFSLPFVLSKADKPLLLTDVNQAVREMRLLKKRTPTYEVTINYYRFALLRSQIERDLDETIRTSDKIDQYSRIHFPFADKARVAEFLLSKAEAFFFKRQYQEAETTVGQCTAMFPPGGNNWFASQTLAVQIAFHSENWNRALEIFDSVTTHSRFSILPERIKEEWKMYEAFLLYILPKRKELVTNTYSNRIFQLYTFLNEVPIYSLDKLGANIAILILQTLWTIETERYDRVLKLKKTLDNYCTRHLNSSMEFERGAIFLRMLRSVISSDFNKERIETRTRKLFLSLTNHNSPLGSMEFYPYEKLWIEILGKL